VELASKFISDECRSDPSLIEAAKTATRKQFRHTLTVTHDQKLEDLETIGPFTYTSKDASQIREFLNWIIEKADLDADDYQGALLYLAIHENEEHLIEAVG
jgi:isopentenyldiphosphate isomerase